MVKNNMVMFKKAMEMFNPLNAPKGENVAASAGQAGGRDDLDALRGQIDALKKQLDELAKRGG